MHISPWQHSTTLCPAVSGVKLPLVVGLHRLSRALTSRVTTGLAGCYFFTDHRGPRTHLLATCRRHGGAVKGRHRRRAQRASPSTAPAASGICVRPRAPKRGRPPSMTVGTRACTMRASVGAGEETVRAPPVGPCPWSLSLVIPAIVVPSFVAATARRSCAPRAPLPRENAHAPPPLARRVHTLRSAQPDSGSARTARGNWVIAAGNQRVAAQDCAR